MSHHHHLIHILISVQSARFLQLPWQTSLCHATLSCRCIAGVGRPHYCKHILPMSSWATHSLCSRGCEVSDPLNPAHGTLHMPNQQSLQLQRMAVTSWTDKTPVHGYSHYHRLPMLEISHIKIFPYKFPIKFREKFNNKNIENKGHLPRVHLVFVSCVYFGHDWRFF